MKKYLISIGVLAFLVLCFTSCSKEAGEGGTSSVFGKVYVKDYNSTYTVLQDEYYAPEEDVYIVYGDDRTFSDRVNTNYDGTFEFKYLRKGIYHIYAYSEDSTLQSSGKYAVIRDVEITKNSQEVEATEIVIFK